MPREQTYETFVQNQSAKRIDGELQQAVGLHQSGKLAEAEKIYETILRGHPEFAPALHFLGLVAHQTGRNERAIQLISKAIKIDPSKANRAMYHANLGLAYEQQHRLEDAQANYQKAVELDPLCCEALNNLGNSFKILGKLEKAAACFKKALKINPHSTEALLNLVEGLASNDTDWPELLLLAENLLRQNLSDNDQTRVCFALGKLYDRHGMAEDAFAYFQRGNSEKRKRLEFDVDAHHAFVSRIIDTFSADFIGARQAWACDSLLPVFIFGMPRSGTTLIEQIIASHPKAFGGGELQFFVQAKEKLPALLEVEEDYPECAHWIHEQTARNLGEVYLKKIKNLASANSAPSRITDKNPFNFLHLGLIALLFPKATFIHCKRHPLDTCLSMYFHHFTNGNAFSYDLTELAGTYRAYRRIMDHWSEVLPVNILEVEYETLVQSQDEVSRRIIEHCALEWDPACRTFHRNNRPVHTASNWQVRQPIYSSSIGRWRKYDRHLTPLKNILRDYCH